MALGGAKKKAPSGPAPKAFTGQVDENEDDKTSAAAPELITEMVGGQVDGKQEEVKVIPALQNTFSLGGAQHLRTLMPPADETEAASSAAAVDSKLSSTAPAANGVKSDKEPMSEDAAAAEAMLSELRSGGASIFKDAAASAQDDTERYRLDVATRADAAEFEAYESMPIEDFGKAYLRGLGWKEGGAVGNDPNAPAVEAIEYVPRPDRLGLGAAPKPKDDPKDAGGSKKRYIKPGESREPKKDLIYVDEHGRQRHVKRVGDKLVEREKTGYAPGALMAITSGAHKGLYARVVSTGGMDNDLKVVLKLTVNGEQMTLPSEACEPVADAKLERLHPGFTHQKAADRDDAGGDDGWGQENPGSGEGQASSDAVMDESRKRRHKEKKEHKERKRDRSDRDHSDRGRDGKRSRDEEKGYGGSSSSSAAAATSRLWVRESIRVRVVDKLLARGQLYNKKGVVVDVSGADCFSLQMDETGKLIEGLTHAAVETALPKRGGAVIVLSGPHRLRRGTLLERNSEEARAVVQLSGDLQIAQCSFDDVAEWVGVLGNELDDADL